MRRWFRYHSLWIHVLAPIWLRTPEKYRWRVVRLLDRSRRRCWAGLVSDALATSEEDACDVSVPALTGETGHRCATACEWMHEHTGGRECSCYCGKFAFLPAGKSREAVS